MSRAVRAALLLITVLLVPAAAIGQQLQAPDVLLKRISEEVLQVMREDGAVQSGAPAAIAALVEAKILPHFDFRRATQIAAGRAWRQASDTQRERLASEFRTLLVRTYAGALAGYRNHRIEFLPLREASDTEATVRSRVRQPGGEPIAVEYDLAREVDGAWKVFDVRIAGISLVATYRSAFAEEVRNYGIDGLIRTLEAKNRQGTNLASRRM